MCEKYSDGEVSIKEVIAFLFKNDHECHLGNLEPYLTEEDRNFLMSFVQEDILLTDQQWNEIDSICENNNQYVEEAPEESLSTLNPDDDDAIENLTGRQWGILDTICEKASEKPSFLSCGVDYAEVYTEDAWEYGAQKYEFVEVRR
ncbi:hypothetical protein WA026_012341 [Henosepilachna vigintioctopunctata]|uniref:Uncharacterized protein n=1 Tax=Henosepilachna vigintioctopunctata TaxID=420089 RepID=A0AAW1UWV9_9CUCU